MRVRSSTTAGREAVQCWDELGQEENERKDRKTRKYNNSLEHREDLSCFINSYSCHVITDCTSSVYGVIGISRNLEEVSLRYLATSQKCG